MAVPNDAATKKAEDTGLKDNAEPELSSIQFSAQYTEEIEKEENEPLPDDVLKQAAAAQEEIDRRGEEILAALDKVLGQTAARAEAPKKKPKNIRRDALKFTVGAVKSGAGLLSLALTLIFLGIVVVCVLISGSRDYLLIAKLSPIVLVFVGGELLLSWFMSGKRLRIHVPCICAAAAVAIAGGILSAALNNEETEIRVEQSGRIIAAQIYEQSYKELCRTVDIDALTVSADIAPGSGDKSWDTLSAGDVVNIAVKFSGNYQNPREFAQECREVISAYRTMGVPVTNFSFVSESRLSSLRLDIDGLFQQDLSIEELTDKVNYISYEDYDYIEDLEDFTEFTDETTNEEH